MVKKSQQIKKISKQRVKELPVNFRKLPKSEWPPQAEDSEEAERLTVWVSKDFIVQLFLDKSYSRISINRTKIKSARGFGDYTWDDGISWDEIQQIKAEIGYGDYWAVELYPPDNEVVNVANMRHLWLLPEPPRYGWHHQ